MLKKEIQEITSTRKDCRNFGLSVGIVLMLIGGVLWWYDRPAYPWFLGIGGMLAFLGLVAPMILKPLQKPWMIFAVLLGFVMARVVLSFLFFLVFTIIGGLARIFGAKLLDLKIDRSADTYWRYRELKPYNPADSERQF